MSSDRAAGLPVAFRDRLLAQLGAEDFERVLLALGQPRVRTLRANRLLTTPEELRAELENAGFGLEAAPQPFEDAFLLKSGELRDLQETTAHSEGRFYLQSLSSMAAVLALDPQPGEAVLDLCAAPGSKTSQIAACMRGRGRLVANDRSRKRGYKLRAVLESQRALEMVELSTARGEAFARREPGVFDRVLLDAPCSSEGRFRLDDERSWADWKPSKVKRLAGEQRRLLLAAAVALRPGGVLVYSTCTFAPEENEAVLHKVLRRLGEEFELVALPQAFPSERPALTSWRDRCLDPRLAHARRILPEGPMEGFFLARIEKRA